MPFEWKWTDLFSALKKLKVIIQGLLNVSAIDILELTVLCRGAALCTGRCLPASLAWMPGAVATRCGNQNVSRDCQMLSGDGG